MCGTTLACIMDKCVSYVINPQHMYSEVIVLGLCVCVCVCVMSLHVAAKSVYITRWTYQLVLR